MGQRMRSVEGSDQVRGMGEFGSGKPLVIRGRITKPVDKVVERGANEMGVNNRLNSLVSSPSTRSREGQVKLGPWAVVSR